jgi:hypothetical protein
MFRYTIPPVFESIVQILFLDGDRIISSGSGFFFCDYLVTCHHVFHGPENTEVVIRFRDSDPKDLRSGLVCSYPEFFGSIKAGSPRERADYAILDIERMPRDKIKNVYLPRFIRPESFMQVAVVGFPFGRLRLTSHHCFISEIYESNGVQTLGLEGSVNVGNSGGPVILPQEAAIIGIVSRKESGLSGRFDLLRRDIARIIKEWKKAESVGQFGGMEWLQQHCVQQQEQLQQLCDELLRSSNTGIASAVGIEHLLSEDFIREREHLWQPR